MYADDLVIICKNLLDLKKMMKMCETLCHNLGISPNVNKCGVMCINGNKNEFDAFNILMDSVDMPYVTKYEYLGLIFNNELKWSSNFDKMVKKINVSWWSS